jgi:hypothetical protein
MTTKIYKTARGKTVDFGSMRLQNEDVRAVGNMGVNARGDRIDSQGNVIDPKNQQLQRRIQRQTNVSDGPVHSSTRDALAQAAANYVPEQQVVNIPGANPVVAEQIAQASVADAPVAPADDIGLAAAIAKAKVVKQELEKTSRQQQQDKPIRKI